MRSRIAVQIEDDRLRQTLIEQIGGAADLDAVAAGGGDSQPADLVVADGPARSGEATLVLGPPPAAVADGVEYMSLPVRMSALLARIRAILRRRPRPARHRIGTAVFFPAECRLLGFDGREHELTVKQSQALAYLCEAPARAASRAELLSTVWGYAKDVETHTVETHVSRLRSLLRDAGAGATLASERGRFRLVEDSGAPGPRRAGGGN